MKLHRLRLQAFGPFAGTEEVDFDALSPDGLHLIHGPTGAGKTSILDAICFALFSGVPGSRMAGHDSLRSDHAGPTARPEVELEFSVGDQRLRVQRSPEHHVAKKRGTGTRAQRGSVRLEELRAGRWETVSTRSDEVASTVGDLLGMGLAQFAQVILLPQGEFAAFLRAKADERGKLLERLFDVSDFAALEHWLTEHRKALAARATQAHAERAALIARAQDTIGTLPPVEVSPDQAAGAPETLESGHAVRRFAEQLSQRLTCALADADAAGARVEHERARVASERALAALQAQGRAAQHTLDELTARATTLADVDRRLELAARADACRPAVSAHARRVASRRVAQSAVDAARDALAGATRWPVPAAHDAGTLTLDALQPLRERAAAGTVALAGQQELARQQRSLDEELRTAIGGRSRAADHLARCTHRLSAVEASIAQHDAERASLVPRAAAHPQWLELLSRLAAVHRCGEQAAGDLTAARSQHREHRAAQLAWARDEEEVLRLRSARLAGIAAELADGLADGSPCPVCGSAAHPQPATHTPDHVDAHRVGLAEAAAAEAAAHAQRAATRAAASATRAATGCAALLDALRLLESADADADDPDESVVTARDSAARALAPHTPVIAAWLPAGDTDAPAVEQELIDAVSSVAQAAGAARTTVDRHTTRAAESVARLRAVEDQLASSHAGLQDARAAVSAGAETARSAAERVRLLEDRLGAVRDRLTELADEHRVCCGCTDGDAGAGHTACVDLLASLLDAAGAAIAADAELLAAHAELDHQLAAHGFADARSVAGALLSDADQRTARAEVEAARAAQLKASGVLEQPDVAAAVAAEPAAVEQAVAASAAAEGAARRSHDAVGDLRRAVQSLDRIADQLQTHDSLNAPVLRDLAVATSLASALSGAGDNVMRMRLSAYVLAARLEAVTTLANERLTVMSGGRYQLEHTDAKAGRGSKSGLGLLVHDAWTGTTRDTTSLSGGESFIASLALALGLGDAVLHAAGGRRLETLLVDEGFGTLDEDSLEQVLDVLDGLRAGGRQVGIVSHVAELRTRIPSQIQVRKTSAGSTLHVRTHQVA